jgi:hypothetical protein
MRSPTFIVCAVSISCALSLTGCSTLDRIIGADNWKDWTPTTTSIQVHMDDSLTETIFDTLDESWYQGNELQDMIARSMHEYNDSHGAGAVNVTSYSDTGGNVKVVIDYRTGEDFAAYNNAVFCCGSMLDAQMQGFLFPGRFYAVEGASLKGEAMDDSEPISHKEYSVVISDGSHVIQVPGQIRYVSEGAEIINSHAAQLMPGDSEPKDIAPEEGQAVPDTGSASISGAPEQEERADALCIIYEKDQAPGPDVSDSR